MLRSARGEDRFSPGCPLGVRAPVERCHLTPKCCASPRRPRVRMCLRKGCGRRYRPRRWNQRYCQEPECLRQLRRWQAAQRQARRRQDEAIKAKHAMAERVRRQRARCQRARCQRARCQRARCQRARASAQASDQVEVAAARGHAAKIFCPSCLYAAGVLRSSAEVEPQPETLLWPCLQPGASPGAGSRT